MSYVHRYIPPVYMDLNIMATPSKDQEVSIAPCSSAKFTAVQSSSDSVKPRPSRTSSLFLDLLDFPLTLADPNSDGIKCNLNSVLDMSDEHDTPAGATHQIFPLPTGHEIIPDQNVNTMKQIQDPEVLKEVETFPAAVFTNTTISTSRLGSTTSAPSESNTTPSQRGGRTSQFSAKQRRERHNANERRRTNAAKDRVRDMRDTVTALGRQRTKLTVQRNAKAAADETLPHRRPVETVVLRKRVEEYRIPGSTTYLDLVKSVDELRDEKQYLEEQLDQLDSQKSVLQAVQTELLINATASLTAVGTKKILKRKRVETDEDIDLSH
ncbi:unnamed protein product [Peronospora destructor]|uniref:BZIP domain-containing protein n=1 Tax=Peronospora destructor TaxID=86335 RepID=A0AAV0TWJ7_9STRA|nr:unnamed protein product [Peronospora destructor]